MPILQVSPSRQSLLPTHTTVHFPSRHLYPARHCWPPCADAGVAPPSGESDTSQSPNDFHWQVRALEGPASAPAEAIWAPDSSTHSRPYAQSRLRVHESLTPLRLLPAAQERPTARPAAEEISTAASDRLT